MIGAALALATIGSRVRRSRAAIAIVGVALVALAGLSMRQATTWQDAASVARRTLAINPRSFTSWNHLGALAARAGRSDEATADMGRAIAIAPDDLPTLLSLGALAQARGDDAAARTWFARAVDIAPSDEAARRGLAIARTQAKAAMTRGADR